MEEVGAVFLGTYEPKLDEKGRLILPAKFRDQLQRGLVITRGQERCLFVFTMEEFEDFQTKIHQAPLTSREARDYQRVLFSGAVDQVPDKQGRISIPANLREYAGLERDLAVLGSGSRVEIWNLNTWNEYLNAQEVAFATREDEVIPGLF